MTAEQVPLAAQIEKVLREIRYAQEDHAPKAERLWSAVLATLQQHEILTADLADANERIRQLDAENQGFMREVAALREQHERAMAALRLICTPLDQRTGFDCFNDYRIARRALDDIDALDNAASAATTPAGKGEP